MSLSIRGQYSTNTPSESGVGSVFKPLVLRGPRFRWRHLFLATAASHFDHATTCSIWDWSSRLRSLGRGKKQVTLNAVLLGVDND